MSRRDGAIVAWHGVPGTAPPQKSRPVGYGVIRAGVHADSMIGVTKNSETLLGNRARWYLEVQETVYYIEQQLERHRTGTLFSLPKETRRTFRREIPLGLAAPDHTVPYGTVLSRDAFPRHFVPWLRSVLSLRDALADISQQTCLNAVDIK
jgi:hypothetical protein